MWVLRLSIALGRLPDELERVLTAAQLAEYQALVELDGPWWGEREASYLRQLCSVTAAAAGAQIPADQFQIEWTIGATPVNLLPSADGLALFADCFGLGIEETPA
ncbi:hypothetical protein R5W23_000845 [Gemmata sp. JC673]|uniref:Uncharacterized protein n=1 Tax=Gemmata algarum TaxID=2975278 RepID=A0ABU5ET45_9BACT|nr:hypothetical protein [Gemmata algarum]MDY3558124.1 hypothetical protein [Gemmata algarum]